MMDPQQNDWTRDERSRLEALPRERTPPAALKERISAELVRRGVLRRSSHSRRPDRRPPALARAAAAAALFLAGALVGRVTTPVEPGEAFTAATRPGLAPAERVQRAGSEYVELVASLAAADGSVAPETVSQGREVALSTLRGAAEYIAKMPGNDPRIERILLDLRSQQR